MENTSLHNDDKELQECIGFHGHFCPGLAIGFRSAKELMRILGASKAGDEELFAIVETDACGADAIQVMTGCTFGKGNFSFLDHGKHAFILGSRRRNIAFRASLRADAEIFDDKLAGCLKRMQSNTATPEERSSFFRLRDDAGRRILDMELEKLLKIEEAKIEFPPKARIVRSDVCPVCKEPVRHDYIEHLHGAPACRSCRASSNT